MSQELPVVIEYRISDMGYLRFYLAPKIEVSTFAIYGLLLFCCEPNNNMDQQLEQQWILLMLPTAQSLPRVTLDSGWCCWSFAGRGGNGGCLIESVINVCVHQTLIDSARLLESVPSCSCGSK